MREEDKSIINSRQGIETGPVLTSPCLFRTRHSMDSSILPFKSMVLKQNYSIALAWHTEDAGKDQSSLIAHEQIRLGQTHFESILCLVRNTKIRV